MATLTALLLQVEVRLKQLEAEYQLRRNELASREKSAVDRLNMHREVCACGGFNFTSCPVRPCANHMMAYV